MSGRPERLTTLRDLGLTDYQARVYLALLGLGASKASQIPAIAGVPRTRVYATMNQLHDKGLVEIIPETPLRYRPVPIQTYLQASARDLREQARGIEGNIEELSRAFALRGEMAVEERGRFEAIYGRRNAHERLMKMYEEAQASIIGVGTPNSPFRIAKSAIFTLQERVQEGLQVRYAFPVTPQNKDQVDTIARFAKIKAITEHLPIYWYVFDQRVVLLNHPIPDDDNFYRGEDIAIWTDDEGIARALETIAEKIWSGGTEPGTVDVTEPAVELARQYVQLLGHRGRPAFQAMGYRVGEELARGFQSSSLVALMDEVAAYWKKHGLGRIELLTKDPLTVEVENFVDAGSMLSVGRTVCSFVEEALRAILESRLGTVEVVESQTFGPGSNRCRIAFDVSPS